jgi:hypothetical protein
VSLKAGLDVCEKSRPHRDSIPGPLHKGYLVEIEEVRAGNILFWTAGVVGMRIWVLRSNLYSFGNSSIISGVIQLD